MHDGKKISVFLQEALSLLESFEGKPQDLEERKSASLELASLIHHESKKKQTPEEKKEQKALFALMHDLSGKNFTISASDQAFRSSSYKRTSDQLNFLIDFYKIPKCLPAFDRLKLFLFRKTSNLFSFILVPLFQRQMQKQTKSVIISAEKKALLDHIKKRTEQNVRLNINYLGEEVLGIKDEEKRLSLYLDYLEYPQINYVSVKISSIFSQINLVAFDDTKEAKNTPYIDKEGNQLPKFVNLDMESYQELHLTVEVFKELLEEEEYLLFPAGIVLQAYLPDSYTVQQELTSWARKRVENGGAPIKVRLVKGANLAHEQVISSKMGWPQPIYTSKIEVDANYKRMLLYALDPKNAPYVNLGVASHNIFEIAFALLLRAENKVEKYVSFEMLEGIFDQTRRVVQELVGDVLLYCPITTKKDFQHAIAYLIRRFDENSGKENFLHHSFSMSPGSQEWESQVEVFTQSLDLIDKISDNPRRDQDRNLDQKPKEEKPLFDNEPDTDFSLPKNQEWANNLLSFYKNHKFPTVPLVIEGKEMESDNKKTGFDPSKNEPLYDYCLADESLTDRMLTSAKNNQENWAKIPFSEKSKLFTKVADLFRQKRKELTGSMVAEGGKTFYQADPEVSEAIDFIEYYKKRYERMLLQKDLEYTPKGTILVASPWNFPVAIPTGGIAASLIAGNTVIFKPAPEAVLSGWTLINLFWEAGVPKEVLQFVNCEDEPVGSKLIQDPRVNGVILTGATSTAKLFKKLRPDLDLMAETGGKNALIITAMADRDQAIQELVHSAFGHAGQKCSAVSLAILEKEVYDDKNFLHALKDAASSLKVGSAWDPTTIIGPLVNEPQDPLLKGLTTLEKGQKYLLRPKKDPTNPRIWSPGIILGVKPRSFIQKTELFGPVLGLIRAQDLDDALRIANSTQYGLTSGLISLDQREHIHYIEKIEAGNLYINRSTTGAIVKRQPFGGCKNSSFGKGSKAGGPNYLRELVHIKQISLPKEKHPLSDEVNYLTSLLNDVDLTAEELGMWYAAISNYAYWWKRMKRNFDPSKILGQDNLFCYIPKKGMTLRISDDSNLMDTLKVLAAALTCSCPLEISIPKETTLGIEWKDLSLYLTVIIETEKEFEKRVSAGLIKTVRLTTKPSESLFLAASKEAITIIDDPVLNNGRFELLQYLREVAISIDYHRHGNLGIREEELRKPVL